LNVDVYKSAYRQHILAKASVARIRDGASGNARKD
jgi:hypothetical protein